MPDTKTTALTENTTPVSTDIIYMVDDPGGSALSQKMTLATLSTFVKSTGGQVLIAENTPSGTGTTTFSSIPATYIHLYLMVLGRSTNASANVNILCYLNNDTTATNYRRNLHYAHGSSHGVSAGDDAQMGSLPGNTAPADSAGTVKIWIPYYLDTTFLHNVMGLSNFRYDTSTVGVISETYDLQWESKLAINRVDLTLTAGNWVAGSRIRLYGVY